MNAARLTAAELFTLGMTVGIVAGAVAGTVLGVYAVLTHTARMSRPPRPHRPRAHPQPDTEPDLAPEPEHQLPRQLSRPDHTTPAPLTTWTDLPRMVDLDARLHARLEVHLEQHLRTRPDLDARRLKQHLHARVDQLKFGGRNTPSPPEPNRGGANTPPPPSNNGRPPARRGTPTGGTATGAHTNGAAPNWGGIFHPGHP